MRNLWLKTTVLILVLSMIAAAGTVAVAATPAKSATISQTTATIDLADTKNLQLSATVLPASASQLVQWKSSETSVAAVSSSGMVTAKKTGKVTIYVRPKNINKISKCTITIVDSSTPSSISVEKTSIELVVGETATVGYTVNPSTANQLVKWASSKNTIASVSSNGVITAKKVGTALIKVYSSSNSKVYKIFEVKVVKAAVPTSITITPDTKQINVGDKLTLTASPVPSTASAGVKWSTSDKAIATVSSTGEVMAKKTGTVKITATSILKSSVRTVRTIKVVDPKSVSGVEINQDDMYLGVSDTVTLTASLLPSGASDTVLWSSSNTSVASVSSTGKVTAQKVGTATITVKTAKDGYTDKVTITVLGTTKTTVVPELTTTISGISANLAKIDAIRLSTLNELNLLLSQRSISNTEYTKRKDTVINAFAMYRFPWMTEKQQNYWSSTAASKAYKVGIVYYGMPYIQCGSGGNYANKRYNVIKALSSGYFTQSSNGYYLMSPTKKLNSYYVGSDCSSFVSMSIWGTNHAASYLNTTAMRSSSYYKTITGSTNMKPGDTLVKSGRHTVLFLYYTNNAKTQMMIIEQGGGTEPNTVACRVKSVVSYVGNGYVIRRPTTYT